MLREGCPHQVYCTKEVHEELNTSFPLFKMLEHWDGGGVIYNEIAFNKQPFLFLLCQIVNFMLFHLFQMHHHILNIG